MKRLLIVTAVLLLSAAFLLSTAKAKVSISLGPELGLNIATLASDASGFDTGKKSRNGLAFGGLINFKFSDYISLQPELRYAMKGAKWEAGGVELTYKIDYVEIPVFFKFSIPTGTIFTPDFMAGPVIAFKASAKYDYKEPGYSENGNLEDIKALDFGLGLGAGGRLAVGPGDAFLNFQYNFGLTNIDDSVNPDDIKNRCLSIMAGYAFRFDK